MTRLIQPPRGAKSCARCIHFAATGTAYVYRPVGGIHRCVGEQARGECRAKPPTRDRKTGDAVWPDVVASEWCAAFAQPEIKTAREAA